MNKCLLGVLPAAILAIQPALAADLPYKAAPYALPVAAPTWSGFYFGANGGYGWGGGDFSFPTSQFFDSSAGQGFNPSPQGGIVGGHFGFNTQFGPWVVGAEASLDWANLRQTQVGAVTPVFPADRYTTKIDSLDSATLRIGYAWANWLLYGRIGAAWARSDLDILSGLPVPGVAASSRQTLTGLTGGGGVEYMLTQNVILGAEYNYANLGRETITTTGVCTLPACAGSAPAVSLNGSNVHVESVVGRISYLFNWPAFGR
jgi:outer membrane immunogenic protein